MAGLEMSGERDAFVQRVSLAMSAGSDTAFQEFYDAYFDRIYRRLLVLTRGNEPLTRELVQNVFIRVARHQRGFATEAMLWAWLKQAARSCHVDWLRRNAKEPLPFAPEIGPSQDEPSVDEDLHAALERSLETLPPEERDLIDRCYLRAEPQQQIAAALGTTRKAVESKLARIRRKLREALLKALNDYALF